MRKILAAIYFLLLAPALIHAASAPDKLVGIHSARVMSQSLPWMAQEAGLFKKYNLDFNLVFISSSSIVTAVLLACSDASPTQGRVEGSHTYQQMVPTSECPGR